MIDKRHFYSSTTTNDHLALREDPGQELAAIPVEVVGVVEAFLPGRLERAPLRRRAQPPIELDARPAAAATGVSITTTRCVVVTTEGLFLSQPDPSVLHAVTQPLV